MSTIEWFVVKVFIRDQNRANIGKALLDFFKREYFLIDLFNGDIMKRDYSLKTRENVWTEVQAKLFTDIPYFRIKGQVVRM